MTEIPESELAEIEARAKRFAGRTPMSVGLLSQYARTAADDILRLTADRDTLLGRVKEISDELEAEAERLDANDLSAGVAWCLALRDKIEAWLPDGCEKMKDPPAREGM